MNHPAGVGSGVPEGGSGSSTPTSENHFFMLRFGRKGGRSREYDDMLLLHHENMSAISCL